MSEVEQQAPPQAQTVDPTELKKFLENPKTRQTLVQNAENFLKDVSRNWFGLERVVRKTQYKNYESAKTVLDLLVMSGLAHSRVMDNKGTLNWKITLDKKDKIFAMKGDIGLIDAQINMLQEKKEAIISAIQLQEPDFDPTSIQLEVVQK